MNKVYSFEEMDKRIRKILIIRTIWNILLIVGIGLLLSQTSLAGIIAFLKDTPNPLFIILMTILLTIIIVFSVCLTIAFWRDYIEKAYVEISGIVKRDFLSKELFIVTEDGKTTIFIKKFKTKNEKELLKTGAAIKLQVARRAKLLFGYQLLDYFK